MQIQSGYIVAWREWKVGCYPDGWKRDAEIQFDTPLKGELVLCSLGSLQWPKFVETTARCTTQDKVSPLGVGLRATFSRHRAPASEGECREPACGIYALKDRARVANLLRLNIPSPIQVYGQVKLWGKICTYTEGYRAEYAYPLTIESDSPEFTILLKRLKWEYGI